jgi:hypothetical protein
MVAAGGKRASIAFDVTDDVLYGIDTPRWLPDNNPRAHELTTQGFPWVGDEIGVADQRLRGQYRDRSRDWLAATLPAEGPDSACRSGRANRGTSPRFPA